MVYSVQENITNFPIKNAPYQTFNINKLKEKSKHFKFVHLILNTYHCIGEPIGLDCRFAQWLSALTQEWSLTALSCLQKQ